MVGTTISHYKVLEKIGQGGMGEVYRATDTKLNRDVALKILPQQFASDSQRMARFQREAEVLASLDHPNIGQIYGIEEAGHNPPLSPGFFRSFNRIESDGLSPIRWVRLQ